MAKQRHSKAYHRYFENYAETSTMSDKGRPVIRRVYVGEYYQVDLPDAEHRRRKLLILLLYLGCASCYLYAGLTMPMSSGRFPAIALMVCLIILIFLTLAVFSRMTAPRKMEIRQWRDSAERLRLFSAASFIALGVSTVLMLILSLTSPEYPLAANWPGMLALAASSVLALVLVLTERETPYTKLPPRNNRPEGSSPIRYEMPD